MIRVFHGPNEFSIAERLADIKSKIGPADTVPFNVNEFDAASSKPSELLSVLMATPFLTERRLVVVRGLLSSSLPRAKGGAKSWDTFFASLDTVPVTTELIFVEKGAFSRTGQNLPVIRMATVEEFPLPRGRMLDEWIAARFAKYKGKSERAAYALLGELCGGDLRNLDSEIQKLIIYSDGRTVTEKDVREMVQDARSANIFATVDKILERNPKEAMRMLYSLLREGESLGTILTMLARQTRLLILAVELRKLGITPSEIGRRMQVTHPFVLNKTLRQATHFNYFRLASIHRSILSIDFAVKTGQLDERIAIEVLSARLSAT